jgi:carbon storage regulator
MLVLTRRLGQDLIITHPDGTEIRICLLSMSGGQARIGVHAPKEVQILRDDAIVREDTKKVTGV